METVTNQQSRESKLVPWTKEDALAYRREPLRAKHRLHELELFSDEALLDLLGDTLVETGYFERKVLRELVADHLSGRRDYSTPLWTLLMFDAFLRNAFDPKAIPADAKNPALV